MTQKEIWDNWTPPNNLKDCVELFFEILDTKEYSGMSDTEFHPTKFNVNDKKIDTCRVWDAHRLGRLMPKMKELASISP